MMYSRSTTPVTFALFDEYPSFTRCGTCCWPTIPPLQGEGPDDAPLSDPERAQRDSDYGSMRRHRDVPVALRSVQSRPVSCSSSLRSRWS